MKTLTDDDGNKYELIAEYGHEVLGLKPLPKQPEAEKKRYYVVVHEIGGDYLLDSKYEWTRKQAQLAADAVRELLKYIQGEKVSMSVILDAAHTARDAIKDSE